MAAGLRIEALTTETGHPLLRLSGKFTVEDSMHLRDILEKHAANGSVIIDGSQLSQINSAAIGVLVNMKMKMSRNKHDLILYGLNKVIVEVLKLTGVDMLLTICSSY